MPALPRLRYREFLTSDRESLLDFVRQPEQLKYMLFSLETEAEVDEFLTLALDQAASPERTQWHWAVEEAGVPGVVGGVSLMREGVGSPSAELGYWFKQSVWGRGYAPEAARFALDFGFGTLGLHRIWGKCHVENRASARVMEKVGMTKEGVVREHAWLRDHWRSSGLYSILEAEFRGHP